MEKGGKKEPLAVKKPTDYGSVGNLTIRTLENRRELIRKFFNKIKYKS